MLPLLHSKCLSLKPPNFLGAVLSKKKHKNKFEELHHHQDQDHLWNIKKQRWDSQRNMLSQVQPRSHAVQRKWGWSSALFREVSISRKCQGFFWKMPRGFLKNAKDVWKSWRFLWGGGPKMWVLPIISWLWSYGWHLWNLGCLRKFSGIFCTKIKWYKSHPVFFWKEPLKNVQAKTNHGIPKESMQSVVCSVRIPNLWQTMGGVVASPRHEFPQNPDKAQLLGSDFLGWTSDCPIWFASCWLLLLFWRKNGWISEWFTLQKGGDFQKTSVNKVI